jgi:hypothetical protein
MTAILVALGLFQAFPEHLFEPARPGGHDLALLGSPIALHHGPALIPEGSAAAFSYARPFSIGGLNYGSFALSRGGFALGGSYFGESAYAEMTVAAGRSISLSDELRAGLAVKGLILTFGESGQELRFDLDASLLFRPSPSTALALGARNLASFASGDPSIRPSFDLSLRLEEREGITGFLDLQVEEGIRPSVRVSQRAELGSRIALSMGLSTEPDLIHLGLRVRSHPELQYAIQLHPYLGETHGLSLCFGR